MFGVKTPVCQPFTATIAFLNVRQLARKKEKVRVPRAPLPRGIEDDQIDLLFTCFPARLHLVFARLADEKSVLFEILTNDAFVDGGHLGVRNNDFDCGCD